MWYAGASNGATTKFIKNIHCQEAPLLRMYLPCNWTSSTLKIQLNLHLSHPQNPQL